MYPMHAKEWLVETEETSSEYSDIKTLFLKKDITIIRCVKHD